MPVVVVMRPYPLHDIFKTPNVFVISHFITSWGTDSVP
jgi:hypothetical protein